MGKTIHRKTSKDPIPLLKSGQWNLYRPEDIKQWGPQRFLDEVCAKEPFPIPDLGFTEEENRLMNEILKEERVL